MTDSEIGMGVADDAELMRRWQRGETAALSALVERWQTPVARFLTRMVGPDRAADLCQETFLRLLRTGDRYREQGTFSTWLFQVALNVARDAGRRKQPSPPGLRPQFAESAEESFERDELSQTVAAAVEQLPANLREVLALRHDAGMNFESMARLLGAPASTLKSRFAVALNRVRHRLAEMGYQAEETHP
jgi:RNA polymerase sigma-70 factor (ECF subfamily)